MSANLGYHVDATTTKPRVLLVNDDGPPGKNSPHVLGLYKELVSIGWDVTVVLPSSQKSWGSMQFSLSGPVSFWYYYPLADNIDGSHPATKECWSATRRPINRERGEIAEWVLVDGSPTTASNAGLFNQDVLFGAEASDKPAFDLVVSGPNFGRNTGTAFALSSGTLGAALAASLAGVRSIAVSYGHFVANPPTLADRGDAKGPGLEPGRLREVAHMANQLSVRIIQRLWAGWANESEVGCYSINLPLSETLTQPEIFWTRIWENRYGPLFAPEPLFPHSGPTPAPLPPTAPTPQHALHFAPQMSALLRPRVLTPGTDVWAVQNGYVSITRLRPNFMQVDQNGNGLDVASLQHEHERDTKGLEDGLEVGKRWRL